MLYNDIAIDGLIKRAARQAAVETVYMLKKAGDITLSGPVEITTNAGETAEPSLGPWMPIGRAMSTQDPVLNAKLGGSSSREIADARIRAALENERNKPKPGDPDYDWTKHKGGITIHAPEERSSWDRILEHLSDNAFTYGGGVGGAGIGALLGDDTNQKLLYALLGGGGGAGLGALVDYLRK